MRIFFVKVYLFSLIFISLTSYTFAREADTLDTNKSSKIETTQIKYETKSPSGAIIRSLIIPGWGQYYVGSYWKAPIFFAGTTTLTYFIIKNNNDFNKFNDIYRSLADKNTNEALLLKNKKEYFRDNRDLAAFYLLGVYVLSAVDAYVGAHLYDFTVDDNLSMNFRYNNNNFYVGLKYHIK